MSNKKSKKQKKLAEKRRSEQIRKLQELKTKALDLEARISEQKKENFKQFNIRNLKVFANTCNFAIPFVMSAGIIVGVFGIFYGGFPFVSDKIKKYKRYDLEFQTNGYAIMETEYRTDYWFDESLPSNSLVVYTPWEEQDGQYIRFKRRYDVKKLLTLNLYNAVLAEDYDYIFENLKNYEEEKQVTNEIDFVKDNNYFFEASLHGLDKDDVFEYNETDLKNCIITIIELILCLGIGGVIAYNRNFYYLDELGEVNCKYKKEIVTIKSMKKELKDINEKILSLTRTKGGKN